MSELEGFKVIARNVQGAEAIGNFERKVKVKVRSDKRQGGGPRVHLCKEAQH